MRPPPLLLLSLPLLTACTPAALPPAEVTVPPGAPAAPPPTDTPAAPPPLVQLPWGDPWTVVEPFQGANTIFTGAMDVCASGPDTTRCLGGGDLGPLARSVISSPTAVWGFTYLCGVGAKGAFLCNKPAADRPQEGPPRLENVAGVTVHAAVHRDGTLSVTSNTDGIGYADPKWVKVAAVTDAVEVASSWYASRSCYRRRSGEVACVDHAAGAAPKPVPGVTDAARLWKTDAVLWVLTKKGDLLATRRLDQPMTTVASGIVDFAPHTAASGATPADPEKGSENPEIPCAVQQDGHLLCALARDWTLTPVPGAGTTRRVFGDYNWICAIDDRGTARCVR